MDLKEFVASTLRQIIEGVEDAQNSTKAKGFHVNPAPLVMRGAFKGQPKQRGRSRSIEFDVAVTVTEGEKGAAAAGITVAGILGAGGRRENTSSNTAVSRIRFSVPVALPLQPEVAPD